jgi:hypothetical protein
MLHEHSATSAPPALPTEEASRWPAPVRRIGDLAARVHAPEELGTRRRHREARMLSMSDATSSISSRSRSSASSAATSAASAFPRCCLAAVSMIARRIASERLRPAACSCASARSASSSKRTLIAVTKAAYHFLSYIRAGLEPLQPLPAANGPSSPQGP